MPPASLSQWCELPKQSGGLGADVGVDVGTEVGDEVVGADVGVDVGTEVGMLVGAEGPDGGEGEESPRV